MEIQLSPSYSHEKLENPTFNDLVDVFEDLWRNYIFSQTELLLCTPNGDIAAMTILCPYFEAIGGYTAGINTDRRAKEFFIKGFGRVFRSDSPELQRAAESVYKYVRCGLAHEGMLGHKVHYSRAGAKAFYLTYRRTKDGSLDFNSGVLSIIINPVRIYEGTIQHFNEYIKTLRSGSNKALSEAFQNIVQSQWAIGASENIIAVTENEFLGRT